MRRLTDYRYEIEQRMVDYNKDGSIKRDITITNKKRENDNGGTSRKWYTYKCNICGFDCGEHWNTKRNEYISEYWILESAVLYGSGCSCCQKNGHIVVEGINDIPTTNPELIKYFQNGYNEAKKYTFNSRQKIQPICPNCGRVKEKEIYVYSICNNKSIGCMCSDNISIGEKIMFSVLEQLHIDFIIQLNKSDFEWIINDKRYDFYFEHNSEQYIIETHGEQHYIHSFIGCGGDTVDIVQENDKFKKELAIKNGVKEENYIIINCQKSEFEFIKQNILNSKLNKLFDLNKIDWLKAKEFSCSNLIKIACDYKNNDSSLTTTQIGKLMGGYCKGTIQVWLKQGDSLGWCHYNPKEEMRKNKGGKNAKQVEILKDGTSLGLFESKAELERQSEKLFGVKLNGSCISDVALGKRKTNHKGFDFKYVI